MNVEELVAIAAGDGASDIHLVCGLPPKYRLHGELRNIADYVLSKEDCERLAAEIAGVDVSAVRELDLARTISGRRIRVNIFRQQGSLSCALRLLSDRIPELETLGVPPSVLTFPSFPRGIILITGETGSGKSTTLAALLDRINHTRADHIITIEDPIEYVYAPDKCVINQREIGRDTGSYADALRAALREDPDVILIGEMRDLETIETALTAAETGHLVFATLHSNSVVDTVDRVVDVFPEGRQRQIRLQLSMTLRAVLSQQLLPRLDGTGRVLACEVMMMNIAIQNLIREGKTPQIANSVATSAQEGSVTMDNALIKLYREKKISGKVAVDAAHDAEYVRKNTGR